MPFTFLAHQAPVLPLKLWRPRWFSGAGLAIGSMAPDFEKFIDGSDASRYAHSLGAQLTYCLPLSLLVYWLLTRVAAAPLARFLPVLGTLRLRDHAASLAIRRDRGWPSVAGSILIGSASHVALDGFTHGDPRVVALLPFLAARIVTIGARDVWLYNVLQVVASILGAAFTIAVLWMVGRERRVLAWSGLDPARVDQRGERSRGAAAYWLTVAVVTLGASGLLALAELAGAGWAYRPGLAYSVALRLPLVGFAALCVAALLTPPQPTAQVDPGSPRAPRLVRPQHLEAECAQSRSHSR